MPADPTAPQHAKLTVHVAGAQLPADIDNLVTEVVVEDNLALPDMIVVTLRDRDHDVLTRGGFTLGAQLEVKVVSDEAPTESLAAGEITALEKDFQHGLGTFAVVRAFDKTHRMARGRKTKAFTNVSYSDVVQEVVSQAELQIGTIDAVQPVHDVVTQANESDWEFLQRLARELGFVAAMLDGKFDFRRPPEPTDAPDPAQLENRDPRLLVPERNLLSLRATVRAAEQVTGVTVRGWDPKTKAEVVGTATPRARNYQLQAGPTPAALGQQFGGVTLEYTSLPLATQGQADALADALAEQVASGMVEIEGVARGSKALGAGKSVALGNLGEPFTGRYVLSAVRHRYTPEDGYATAFTVSGRQDRSLLNLAAGGSTPLGGTGLMPAIVTDVKDPDNLLRVKLKFPWLDATYVSDWARVIQPGAGGKRGSVLLPEVNDEVLVAFDQGDFRRPYVVGGVYNGVDKPQTGDVAPVDQGTGAIDQRSFVSRAGHGLTFVDKQGKEGVVVQTSGGTGKQKLELLAGENKIKVTGDGEVTVSGKGKIVIESTTADLELSALNIKINAKTNLELTASAGAKIDGGAMTEVKGGVVKLN